MRCVFVCLCVWVRSTFERNQLEYDVKAGPDANGGKSDEVGMDESFWI